MLTKCVALIVGTSMAEILSSIPISGGPYFWAYMLAPAHHAPFFAWFTGWFNLIGQIAITAGADFGLANLISTTASVVDVYSPSAGKTLGIMAVILVSHVAVNVFSVRTLRYIIYTAVCLNTIGITSLAIALLAKAPHHQSARFVFASFYDGTAATPTAEGWSMRASHAYLAACGALFSQYTLLGFDASAHLCEETQSAVRAAPRGLLLSIAASIGFGFLLLLALLFSIQDFAAVRESPLPVLTILTDACGQAGGVVLMILIMLCVWHCGLLSLVCTRTSGEVVVTNGLQTSNSRMMFAFARDGGIPHKLHIISNRFQSPVRTVIFGATCAFLLTLPSLGSQAAFAGTTSIATVGLYVSYGIPILLSLVWPRLRPGAFYTGRLFSKVFAVIACLWIGFITIAFCLPTVNPVTSQDLNYTPVALGIVLLFTLLSWQFWARHWFTGRCRHHCRICIRQLDLLGSELVDREQNKAQSPRHSKKPTGWALHFRSFEEYTLTFLLRNIIINRDFEVFGPPSRGFEEIESL